MRKLLLLFSVILFSLTYFTPLHAQEATEEPVTGSGVEILWPPPVSEVWGSGDVIGTAAVPGMAYYYLEYLALNDDLTLPATAPWIPATIGIEQPVVNDKLVTLDTTLVPDGLYALRLVVNTVDGQSYSDTVAPVRVNNERFNRVIQNIVDEIGQQAETTPTPSPSPAPTSTPIDNTPYVNILPNISSANVRRCDIVDNNRCPQVGYISAGERGNILALSSNGTGWYEIQLPSGLVGWISPTVVQVFGNTGGLPFILPPAPLDPPPPPPTPIPTATTIPNGIAIEGNPTCNRTFNVQVNIANTGNSPSQAGTVTLQDVNTRTGEVTYINYGAFPSIGAGGNYVVVIPVTVSIYYNEQHELRAYSGGQQISQRYTLGQGNCGAPPPTPTPPSDNAARNFGPNECFVVMADRTPAYETPFGNVLTTLAGSAREAQRVRRVNGTLWYRIEYPDLGRVWVQKGGQVSTQGDCGLRNN